MLSDSLIQALRDEHYEHGQCRHTDPGHCHSLMIAGALWRSDEQIETEEEYQAAGEVLMDETLSSLILRGYIEPAGIDENGEWTIQATPLGIAAIEGKDESGQGQGQES